MRQISLNYAMIVFRHVNNSESVRELLTDGRNYEESNIRSTNCRSTTCEWVVCGYSAISGLGVEW